MADEPYIYPADGFVFHHSGGSTLDGLRQTLQQRGLGSQYLMDRDGSIYNYAGLGSPHIRPNDEFGGIAPGLSNKNAVGMEVVARDNNDVTPAQIDAARNFISTNYPNTPVYGHGEINPGHKQADEGMAIVNAIRTDRGHTFSPATAEAAGSPPMATPKEPTPYAADDYHLNGYRNLLAAEQAGTLQPGQADALARGRSNGMFALLDQAIQAQENPPVDPTQTLNPNAPQASFSNPAQGAADQASFEPRAEMPVPQATYRPYATGFADRLGLVSSAEAMRDPVTGRTPTGVNAPDLTQEPSTLGGYGSDFPTRLIASLQRAPRALEEHPLSNTARIIGHLYKAPGDFVRSMVEESQGSRAAGLAGLPVDIASALSTPLPYVGSAGGGLLDALSQAWQTGRGVFNLWQALKNYQGPGYGPGGPMPGPTPMNQGPLPPTGRQSPYYVPPGTTFH